jgi:DNA-binding NarL/FixJ family response regulator
MRRNRFPTCVPSFAGTNNGTASDRVGRRPRRVRQGLRSLLELQPGWKVVAETATGKDAVTKVRELNPDVAILDISMPSLNGLEAARQIVEGGSKTRILILTIHDSDAMIKEMLDIGVRGYVLKSDAARDLVVAVEALQRNQTFFTSKVAEMVLDGYLKSVKNPTEMEPAASRITSRQREISDEASGRTRSFVLGRVTSPTCHVSFAAFCFRVYGL